MATKTWTGGAGTWDSTSGTNWSGGTAPVNGDTIVFDGTSGTGTVTVAANVSGQSFVSLTMTAFVGTLDCSINNPNLTFTTGVNAGGSAVSALKMGSGTWTLTASNGNAWNLSATNFTLTAGTSTIQFSGSNPTNNINFVSGGLTYNNVTVAIPFTSGGSFFQTTGIPTIATLTLTPPCNITFGANATISTALVANGTSASNAILMYGSPTARTLTLPASQTLSWVGIANLIFTNSPVANNSFDFKGNSGITINAPTGSGVISPIGS